MKELRDYQQTCVDFISKELANYRKPFVYVLPTGAGKSLCISEIAKRWGRVLVLTLSKELCFQDYQEMLEQGVEASIYSASWKKKEVGAITVATIMSAYKQPWLFANADVVLIDETDSVDCSRTDSVFMKLLIEINKIKKQDGGRIKVCGLTASPWRTVQKIRKQGRFYETTTMIQPLNRIPCKGGFLWSKIVEGLTMKEATERGYLTPVEYYSSPIEGKLVINSSGNDFTEDSLDVWGQNAVNRCYVVMKGAEEKWNIGSGIVALPFIRHAEALQALCEAGGVSSVVVHSKTPQKDREEAIRAFKNGEIKWLIQCGVALIGFNSPITDCLLFCRPTLSLRIWCQSVGRIVRLSEGKRVARVLDLTNTYQMFGRAEDVHCGKDGYKTTIEGNHGVISGKPLRTFHFTKKMIQEDHEAA